MPASDKPTPKPHTDFSQSMSYGDYLRLDDLLAQQKPVSDAHDEMMFIIIHQASELWMKLIVHELTAACAAIRGDALGQAFKMSARVSKIQTQMIQSWDVLATMTPAEYLTFRHKLGHASGFQSHQYRTIEFLLGAKDASTLAPHAHRPDIHGALERVLLRPACTTRRSVCWRAAASRSIPPISGVTSPCPTPPTRRSRRPGSRSIATPRNTGTSTSSPRSWSTSRTRSRSGASGT